MKSFFDTAERIALLEFKAGKWVGTPFFPNSNEMGPQGGVSCQKLCSEIYRACGFADLDVPEVPMSHAQFSNDRSLVEEFMAKREEFSAVPTHELQAGDLLGFRMGKVVHHSGIYLGGQELFIHATVGHGVTIASLRDGTWSSRLSLAWRPIRTEVRSP